MAEALLTSELLTRLEQLRIVSRRLATGRMRGERRSRQRGCSTDFADYRNYVPGDDTRYLDWKIYARLEKLCLKLFLAEEDLRVYLLIDVSPSMDHGEPNKLFYARRAAAAIGYLSLCNMDQVTVYGFAEKLVAKWGPKRGKLNGPGLLDFLQHLKPGAQTAFPECMRAFGQATRGKGVILLMTDFYDFRGYEEGLRYLFGRNFEVFILHLLAPDELKPAFTGDIRLVDKEFSYTTDISVGKSLLARYERTLNAFCHGLRNFVLARGGQYVLCGTDLPFEQLVLDVFCRKGLLQ